MTAEEAMAQAIEADESGACDLAFLTPLQRSSRYLAALGAAGWVVVPREPTEDMTAQTAESLTPIFHHFTRDGRVTVVLGSLPEMYEATRRAWSAMIAAAQRGR